MFGLENLDVMVKCSMHNLKVSLFVACLTMKHTDAVFKSINPYNFIKSISLLLLKSYNFAAASQ